MKTFATASGIAVFLILCFVLWYVVASDYGDGVISGTYELSLNGEKSSLELKPDHTFQQELNKLGKIEHATGTWRRVGEADVTFSKEFLAISGQELGPHGEAYGYIHKDFGVLVSLTLAQYHVLWYGKTDPSPINSVTGTYVGDEEGVPARLIVKADRTFEQEITNHGITHQAKGSWSVNQHGDIAFSRAFLKTSGEPLREDETAFAWYPTGSDLQIQIAVDTPLGVPTFRKRRFRW